MRTRTTLSRALISLVLATALLATAPLTAVAQTGEPPPQLVVTNVVTDLAGPPCTLMARGRNFERNPGRDSLEVRLADERLDVIDWGDTWLLADFDCATPPGDYLLTVRRGPSQTDFDALSLTVGAVGPPGPEGPPGEPGPPGAPGPSGFAGLEVAHLIVGWPQDSRLLHTVVCPGGKRVIGGAWKAWLYSDPSVPALCAMGESYPYADDVWAFRPHDGAGCTNAIVDYMAICVDE